MKKEATKVSPDERFPEKTQAERRAATQEHKKKLQEAKKRRERSQKLWRLRKFFRDDFLNFLNAGLSFVTVSFVLAGLGFGLWFLHSGRWDMALTACVFAVVAGWIAERVG